MQSLNKCLLTANFADYFNEFKEIRNIEELLVGCFYTDLLGDVVLNDYAYSGEEEEAPTDSTSEGETSDARGLALQLVVLTFGAAF